MAIGKIKPTVTIAAQFVAGVEVDCISHEGKLFLPVMNLGEFAPTEAAPPKEKKVTPTPKEEAEEEEETPKTTKKSAVKESEASGKVYTEEEMMDMDSKELNKILKGMGVDPDKFDGKNTNKKLRLLILDNQEAPTKKAGKKASAEKEEPEEDDDLVTEVTTILENFDAGKLPVKKALAKLLELAVVDDPDADAVSTQISKFEDDADAEIDTVAEKIAGILRGETPKKEKATKKGGKKAEVLVTKDELEVGQRVSVYWDDQEEWYDGEVASIKKGKVVIDYDDDTSEPLDDNNTKIKLLS
jgi:hypothetical protein